MFPVLYCKRIAHSRLGTGGGGVPFHAVKAAVKETFIEVLFVVFNATTAIPTDCVAEEFTNSMPLAVKPFTLIPAVALYAKA